MKGFLGSIPKRVLLKKRSTRMLQHATDTPDVNSKSDRPPIKLVMFKLLCAARRLKTKTTEASNVDYEAEITNLKKRVEELETCCAEFRSCKDSMAERIEAVEKKL